MFQSFDNRAPPGNRSKNVARLREQLAAHGLAGYVVTHADEHQSEYLPPSAERLAWLTGFTGSAGAAVVMTDEAALFVDGRYTIQAASEVDSDLFEIVDLVAAPPAKWLAGRGAEGLQVGYDPMLLTVGEVERLRRRLRGSGTELVALEENLIDAIWTDRPEPPTGAVSLHPISHAGRPAREKIAELQATLGEKRVDAAVLTLADSIAWTFNIRGADVAHNPAPLAFAVIRANGRPTLYIDGRKLSNSVRSELSDLAEIAEPGALAGDILRLAAEGSAVALDPSATPIAMARMIEGAGGQVVQTADPTALPKARKNPTELDGIRRAHVRDGIALTRFLAWFDNEAPSGSTNEIAAVEALERFRAETAEADGEPLADISFDTIAGAGPNGAIVHYRVTRGTNRAIEPNSLFLVDSGGQYRDGTTDVTRTIAVGTPTDDMRSRYTLVLKGMVAVTLARFPRGTTGTQLDSFARASLWRAGLDYDHGTGHGVGAFLSVHEGPARISKTGTVALETGMVLSNEPGYYRPGAFGIRIENLIAVTEAEEIAGGERPMHGFETLTLAPLDRRLIDVAMLSEDERAWIDAYHARVRETLSPRLDEASDRAWLEAATRPLGET